MQPSGITLEALRFKSAKLQCVAHVGVLFHLTENPPPPFSHCIHMTVSPQDNNSIIVKYPDDMTILGLIRGRDESSYRELVHRFTVYGEDNDLVVNLDKAKELIVDFRRKAPLRSLSPSRGRWWNGLKTIISLVFTLRIT